MKITNQHCKALVVMGKHIREKIDVDEQTYKRVHSQI